MMHTARRLLALGLSLALTCTWGLCEGLTPYSDVDILAEEGGDLDPWMYADEEAGDVFLPGNGEAVAGRDAGDAAEAGEEGVEDMVEAAPGDYEWYLTPTLPVEGHAYIDIYPEVSPVYAQHDSSAPTGVAWHYAFVLNNTSALEFTPTFINIIPFWDNGAFATAREQWHTYYSEELPLLMGGTSIAGGSTCVFQAVSTDGSLCALAISVTGKDSTGKEMEFHSMVLLDPEIHD